MTSATNIRAEISDSPKWELWEERLLSEPKEDAAQIKDKLKSLARADHEYEKRLADVRAEEKAFLGESARAQNSF